MIAGSAMQNRGRHCRVFADRNLPTNNGPLSAIIGLKRTKNFASGSRGQQLYRVAETTAGARR